MNCKRCNGLMYPMELRDRRSQARCGGYVCMMCGEVVDAVIAGNRTKTPQEIALMLPAKSTRRRRRFRRLAVAK